jgi:hypothetical protein
LSESGERPETDEKAEAMVEFHAATALAIGTDARFGLLDEE